MDLYGDLRTCIPTSLIIYERDDFGLSLERSHSLWFGKYTVHLTSMIWNDYERVIYETEHNSVPSRTQGESVEGSWTRRWLNQWAPIWNTIRRHARKYKVVLEYEYWAVISRPADVTSIVVYPKAWQITGIPKILTDISMDAVK